MLILYFLQLTALSFGRNFDRMPCIVTVISLTLTVSLEFALSQLASVVMIVELLVSTSISFLNFSARRRAPGLLVKAWSIPKRGRRGSKRGKRERKRT